VEYRQANMRGANDNCTPELREERRK